MQSFLGVVSFALGSLAALFFGGWALVLSVRLVADVAGVWAAVVAAVLFPVTVVITPWYAAMRGDWMLVIVAYGGGLVALLLIGAGSAVVVSHLGSNSGFGKPRRRLFFWSRSRS